MSNIQDPSICLAEMISLIYRRGMTTTSGGNLSVNELQGGIWITPAGIDKGSLTPEDIVFVGNDGGCRGKHRASSELPIHRCIYGRRPDVGALIHAHPEALVAFAVAGMIPNLGAIPQGRFTCGKVALARYELPGSEKLGEAIADVFASDPEVFAVVMENHGVVVAGRDLDDAFQRFETLELCARALIHAREVGDVHVLNERQLQEFDGDQPGFLPVSDTWEASKEDGRLREQICQIVRRACRQNLMMSSYGTVSHRVGEEGDDHFVMTPHGVSRLKIKECDLVTVRNGEVVSGGRPSRAMQLHRAIYQKYAGIRSIITTQAPSVMAHAVARQAINVYTNPESWVFVRDISLVPFGVQLGACPAVPECLTPDHPVAIIENDCVIAIGDNMTQAFDRVEVAELTASAVKNG